MDTIEYIDAYHRGTLSTSEAEAFSRRLDTDHDFRTAYEEYMLARHVSGALAYTHAKEKISRLRTHGSLTVSHRKQPASMLLRIAAAFLFLIAGAFVFSQLRYSDQALSKRHYQSAALSMRAPHTNGAVALIDAGKFNDALAVLEDAADDDLIAQALRAEALAKTERIPEAISIYQRIADDTTYFNRDNADFAVALMQLRTGDNEKAQVILDRIATSEEHDYRFEARKLNKELNSIWRKLSF